MAQKLKNIVWYDEYFVPCIVSCSKKLCYFLLYLCHAQDFLCHILVP